MLALTSDSIRGGVAKLSTYVGEPGFGDALVGLLNEMANVDHILVLSLENERLVPLLAASRASSKIIEDASRRFIADYSPVDPLLAPVRSAAACTTPQLFRADVQAMPHRELFELLDGPSSVRERLVIAGRAAQVKLAVSLVRPARLGPLNTETADRLLGWSPIILTLIASHSRVTGHLVEISRAFHSVGVIEDRLATVADRLSLRQRQVCARILFGMLAEGIAIDLKIGTETVATHRKEAYRRLGIANQFELTRWYLTQLSSD